MLFFCGTLGTASGVLVVVFYIKTAIIERWGEADQSLLFWLSFMPMLGIPAIISGGIIMAKTYNNDARE